MIKSIQTSIIWKGRNTGATWFIPRACKVPHPEGDQYVMTCQNIGGSDVFGPVHHSVSTDSGQTWPGPHPIPGLERRDLPNGMQEGVCDIVPEYHPQTDTVLAMGHNVYYRDNVLTQAEEDRHPVYTVRTRAGAWDPCRKLEWHDAEVPAMYTSGCAQRVTLPDGRILIPLSVGMAPEKPRSVCSAICSFDGTTVRIEEMSNSLHLDVGRGLLEPCVVTFQDRYLMTIRAEDGRGYVSVSTDGLTWGDAQPWCWDDGEPLSMSTTQQRWITHSDGLFLVYTRKAEANANVMRWRAPLYIAEVNPDTMRLKRSTERIVFPLLGDGINDPDHVARMGNFHTLNVSPTESWIMVGETLPNDGWGGNTLMARITWTKPNGL